MPDDTPSPTARPGPLVPVPDLAGTPASDAAGHFFGEVYGSLADAGTGLIRYLDFDVHGADRHVLVPIGHVRVARAGEPSSGVQLRAARTADLGTIPPYEPHLPGGAPPPDEAAVLAAHGRLFAGETYYAHPAYDHTGLYAGEQPIVRAGSAPAGADVARLSSLGDYELAEGEPDVRGWPLITGDGVRAGTVEDLVVDPDALRARYLLVRGRSGADGLVPVGYIEVDRDGEAVRAPALEVADIDSLPAVTGAVRRSDEDAVRTILDARLDGPRLHERADFRSSLR